MRGAFQIHLNPLFLLVLWANGVFFLQLEGCWPGQRTPISGGPVYLSLSGTSSLVCPAWVALSGTWRSRRHSPRDHLSTQALSPRQGGDTDTVKTTQILEVTEMKTLIRIINKTRINKMRNERIREICGIQTVTSWVQRRRTEWCVHISWTSDDRLARRVHDATPVVGRNRGRPMKRWRDALMWTGPRPTRK